MLGIRIGYDPILPTPRIRFHQRIQYVFTVFITTFVYGKPVSVYGLYTYREYGGFVCAALGVCDWIVITVNRIVSYHIESYRGPSSQIVGDDMGSKWFQEK